ncbi:recombinase family protein [Amycolatopsis sp. WQ 127309]|uniref:recombinase family protein n=1 Tax=Amycolatopsis sp. WQ 127309 TaxID=2932773 RepID=UPI001FF4EC71|nr:recombinase family protein [Amycolatopsis sp. WQ 127309]UOZ10524.1 recombinase family protein [Amycolatopsis sp. WQ 127309]
MPKRAILYRRESVAGEEKVSLEVQERQGRQYCERKGYQVVGVESDSGMSGFSVEYVDRPGVVRTIERVERGEADVVVPMWVSRLSRDELDQAVIWRRIERAGGKVDSVTEGDDPFTQGIHKLVAVEFSREKSRTWKAIKERRNALGLLHGGQTPWGYEPSDVRDTPPTPHETNGPVMLDCYQRYVRGAGHRSLVDDLNERGFRTTRGKLFSLASFTRLMDSGFAAGFITVGDRLVKGAHVAIVSDTLWREYRRERERRSKVHPKARQPHHWPLGGGLTTCATCGTNLSLNRYEEPSYARCSKRLHKGKSVCAGVEIRRAMIDTAVGLWLGSRITELAAVAADARDVDERRAAIGQRLAELHEDEQRIVAGRSAAARLVASGDMTEDDFITAKRDADHKLESIVDAIATAHAELNALEPTLDVYDQLSRDAAETPEEWHVRLRKVIRVVRVSRDSVTVVPWHGEPHVVDRRDLQPVELGGRRRGANGKFLPKTA